MDTATTSQPNSTAENPRSGRPRLVLIGAAAALTLLAGGTGAVAATAVRHTDQPGTASGGPSLYIPSAGGPQGSGGTTASDMGLAAGAPAYAGVGAAAPGRSGGAYSSAPANSSMLYPYPYPYPGFCSGQAPAQVTGQVVTATGMSRLDVPTPPANYVLNAQINEQGPGDVQKLVTDAQAKLNAVVDALVKAGVPKSSIHTSNVNVWVSGGVVPLPASTPGNPPKGVAQTNVNASLQATLGSLDVVDKAVAAATGAGANGVNVSTAYAQPSPPGNDAVSAGITQATGQARQLAEATAKAAGVTLGSVHAVVTQQPTLCGWGPDGPQMVVAVTVAYDLK
jgi:uncharacterized protein YggE